MAGDEALVMTSLVLIMAIFLRRRRTFFRRMRLMALQTRRMRRNAVMLSIQQQNNINHRKRKTTWVYPRPQFWFEQLVVNHYQDHLWREHFRVSRDTFEYIVVSLALSVSGRTQFSAKRSPWKSGWPLLFGG